MPCGETIWTVASTWVRDVFLFAIAAQSLFNNFCKRGTEYDRIEITQEEGYGQEKKERAERREAEHYRTAHRDIRHQDGGGHPGGS